MREIYLNFVSEELSGICLEQNISQLDCPHNLKRGLFL